METRIHETVQMLLLQTRSCALQWEKIDHDTHVTVTNDFTAQICLFQQDVRGPSKIVLSIKKKNGARLVIYEPDPHISETLKGKILRIWALLTRTNVPWGRGTEENLENLRIRKDLADLYALVSQEAPVILT